MHVLRLLYCTARLAYNRWALREIDPLHPDLPKLLLQTRELEDRFRKLSG